MHNRNPADYIPDTSVSLLNTLLCFSSLTQNLASTMASIRTILLFSSLVISFFLFANPVSSSAAPETPELIDKICRQMEDYGFCNQVFQHWLRAPLSGLVDLTQITLETTTENASNNFMFVQAMHDHSTDPNGKSALDECMSQYEVITDAFTEAIRLFTSQRLHRHA